MRVAHIMLAKGFGGAERSFVDLCRELGARGHDILAIGHPRGRALQALQSSPGVSCLGITAFGGWDRYAGYRIERALREFKPDIVQAHLARAALLGGRAARSLAVPALAKTHNLVDLDYYRYLTALVPTTLAQASHLRDHGIDRSAITLIPNFSALPAVAEPRPRAPGPLRVKTLGRYVHKKGFDLLLAATAVLVAQGRALTVTIAGDGSERAVLERYVAAHGLSSVASLPEWVDDAGAFLADADVFVLSSRDEPFGIVLLEAMASGVPIIATPTAGPAEILSPDTAVVLEDISSAAIAGALAAVQDDPSAAIARAGRALAVFRQRYEAAVVVEQYLALYRRLATHPRR